MSNSSARIVLTGGPGAGKTTAADLFRREMEGQVEVVPEAATLLYSGGFPRSSEPQVQEAAQYAIYQVQKSLETSYSFHYSDQILLCDRGTVDGSVYWPHGVDDFFEAVSPGLQEEFERYHTVIFFESAAMGEMSIRSNNPIRNESNERAKEINLKLFEVWSQHPRFFWVQNKRSFMSKINNALDILRAAVDELQKSR